jgi:hypothetical protein
MPRHEYEAQVAAFISARGVTRCPTACVAPTQGSGDSTDRAALRQRTERLEALREERARRALPWSVAVA